MDDGAGHDASDTATEAADPASLADLDVAVAHWHVNAWGGAEYLVTRLAETLGVERVYTIGEPDPDEPNPYGDVAFDDVTGDLDLGPVRWVQRRLGRPAEYALWEDVDWRRYGPPDVLVTSGATTRAVITPDETVHLNYCHSPPRWLYDLYHDRKGSLVGKLARPLLRYLRLRDVAVDTRVDGYFANSPIIASRLQKYYNRDSEVLYPPIDVDSYYEDGDDGFYLHLGRLDEEKGVPAIVESFQTTDVELVLAGGRGDVDGAVMDAIRRADNVEYRGFVDEADKRELLATCRAVVFNGTREDFGIVPVEANASGKPVLARDDGFPGVFVTDGENGLLHDGSAGGITQAVSRIEQEGVVEGPFSAVERFSTTAFDSQLTSSIVRQYGRFQATLDIAHND